MTGDHELTPFAFPLGGWDPLGIRPRFGTYRGCIRLLLACTEQAAGRLSQYRRIQWHAVRRVVFVCRGNICRSAYAEHRASIYGLPVASFGLSADTGRGADPRVLLAAARRGIDLTEHRSCDVSDFRVRDGDLLAAMETRQARALSERMASAAVQVTLLGLWSRPARPHIHDPQRLGDPYLERCLDVIDQAAASLAGRSRVVACAPA